MGLRALPLRGGLWGALALLPALDARTAAAQAVRSTAGMPAAGSASPGAMAPGGTADAPAQTVAAYMASSNSTK